MNEKYELDFWKGTDPVPKRQHETDWIDEINKEITERLPRIPYKSLRKRGRYKYR